MYLIEDNQTHLLSVLPLLTASDPVPFLRRCHYYISLLQTLNVRREVAAQLHH
jgi:hypothetical protein